ncbi:MAG: hypothetical protein JKY09_05695, partial [Crocinitomicaceae bacterium]|nr:hypothetical protein [Crocinitomicaceae bacterium]
MRTIQLFLATVFTVLVSSLSYSQSCTYELQMQDTYGDGWDGSTIDVYLNGALQGTYTVVAGDNTNIIIASIPVNDGDDIDLVYTDNTGWDSEVLYSLVSPIVGTVFSAPLWANSTTNDGTYADGIIVACGTCYDGIQNGSETGIDCGGDCEPCHCTNGVQDADEEGIDCGGSCAGGCPVDCTVSAVATTADGCCDYTLDMFDSSGDGWNKESLEIVIDGVVVQTVAATGPGSTVTINVCYGQDLSLNFVLANGSKEAEVSATMTDPEGNVIYTMPQNTAEGNDLMSTTATCPPVLDCTGGDVGLVAVGFGENVTFLDADFNADDVGAGWVQSPNVDFSEPCLPSYDGNGYLWMGSSTSAPRLLETQPVNVECGGEVCFWMAYAIQAQSSPCEGPDLATEGIYFEYSVDGGSTWTTIHYEEPLDGGTNDMQTNWNEYCFDVPAGA